MIRPKPRYVLSGAAAACLAAALIAPAQAASSSPVTDTASASVPQILGQQCYAKAGPAASCRQVLKILLVGGWVYVAGQIDSVRDPNTGVTTTGFSNLIRFSVATHRLDTTFKPQFFKTAGQVADGAVSGLAAAANGQSLYVGGSFNSVRSAPGGTVYTRKGLAKISTANGAVDAGFNAKIGAGGGPSNVNDVQLIGQSLWVGGTFAHVANASRTALATVDPTTGALTTAANLDIKNPPVSVSPLQVHKIGPSPSAAQAVLIGNFGTVLGQTRQEVAVVNVNATSGAVTSLNTWNAPTNLSYAVSHCSPKMFWPRGVAWSQDGSSFMLAAKGAGHVNNYPGLCDAFSVFANNGNPNSTPTGYNHTVVDSVISVCTLGQYAYLGGHFKQLNHERRINGEKVKIPAGHVNEVHYGLGVIDTTPGNMLAVSGWNQTDQTGRGAGWSAALCVPGPGSAGGGVYMGGDAIGVNGNKKISKLAYFPSAG